MVYTKLASQRPSPSNSVLPGLDCSAGQHRPHCRQRWVKVQRLLAYAPVAMLLLFSGPPFCPEFLSAVTAAPFSSQKTGRILRKASHCYYLCRRKEREGISGILVKNGTGLLLDAAAMEGGHYNERGYPHTLSSVAAVPALTLLLKQLSRPVPAICSLVPSPAALLSLWKVVLLHCLSKKKRADRGSV